MRITTMTAIVLLGVAGRSWAQQPMPPAILQQEFIADSMPTPQCHASTIVGIDGMPAVAWFGGSYEGCADVCIWFSRKTARGWRTPVRVADGVEPLGGRYACWNPVLHRMQNGTLLLFYKVGPNPREWWGMFKSSHDGGATWSAAVRIPEGGVGPVRNHPLTLPGDELLCPSSTERSGWKVQMERTSDGGRSWAVVGPLNDGSRIEAIQPALADMGDGRILAVGRTRQGSLFRTTSPDGGWSWSPMTLCDFLCSNSGVDMIRLADGRFLLAYNHARNVPGAWNVGRDTLAVALSSDGSRWEAGCLLEVEKGAELSYPSAMQSPDGLVHITYTWKRSKIRHVVLDVEHLQPRPFRGVEWE